MLMQADVGKPCSAHVIVLGNEKGGSGKSTRQCMSRSRFYKPVSALPRSISTRARRASRTTSKTVATGRTGPASSSIILGIFAWRAASAHDFVVIDTPGADSYLMRLAHSMADTLITPLNDSFVDFDVLGMVDPITFELTGVSHYAEMVREARRQRRLVDGGLTDWVIVRIACRRWAPAISGWWERV
jgi:chromosome partitioning protein